MPDLALQLTGAALLLVGLWLGEMWLQRRAPQTGAPRQARALAIMAGVGGLVGAPEWWQNLPHAFSWALPPVAAHYLAVAAVAFGVTALRAAWIGSVGHLRMIAWMLAVYLGPLGAAAFTLHFDRFDFSAPITYGFFAIVLIMLAASLATLFRLTADERGMSSGVLGLIGTLSGLWGLALFLWPAGPWPLLWPWPADPLTSRLIASMALTVATACHYAEGPPERRTAYILCGLYGAGIAAATALGLYAGKSVSWAYLGFWLLVAVAALWGLLNDRGPLPKPATSHPD